MTTGFYSFCASLTLVLTGCNASNGLDLQTTGTVTQVKSKISSNKKKIKPKERMAVIAVHKER